MFGKKNRSMIQYNYNYNNEIDYDKLAEAIVSANEKFAVQKEKEEKERMKKAELPKSAVICNIVLGLLIVCLLAVSIAIFFNFEVSLGERIITISKLLLVAFIYIFLIVVVSSVSKNKDRNFGFNMLSLFFAICSFVVSLLGEVS